MMRGVEIVDTTIDGDIANLVVNGVDVAPLVEAELDRRYPDRPRFRPSTADGFRAAWDLNERLWTATVARARKLDPERLHESVNGEWSFIQTLRHLAFASESWVGRCLLGDQRPWHPLSLPWDQMEPREGVPWDRDARPSLTEALALRSDAMALVRRWSTISPTIGSRNGSPPWSAQAGPIRARRSPSGSACSSCSTRSGSTGCTPSATWPCSREGPDGWSSRSPAG